MRDLRRQRSVPLKYALSGLMSSCWTNVKLNAISCTKLAASDQLIGKKRAQSIRPLLLSATSWPYWTSVASLCEPLNLVPFASAYALRESQQTLLRAQTVVQCLSLWIERDRYAKEDGLEHQVLKRLSPLVACIESDFGLVLAPDCCSWQTSLGQKPVLALHVRVTHYQTAITCSIV